MSRARGASIPRPGGPEPPALSKLCHGSGRAWRRSIIKPLRAGRRAGRGGTHPPTAMPRRDLVRQCPSRRWRRASPALPAIPHPAPCSQAPAVGTHAHAHGSTCRPSAGCRVRAAGRDRRAGPRRRPCRVRAQGPAPRRRCRVDGRRRHPYAPHRHPARAPAARVPSGAGPAAGAGPSKPPSRTCSSRHCAPATRGPSRTMPVKYDEVHLGCRSASLG